MKRILTFLLAVVLCASALSLTAFAERDGGVLPTMDEALDQLKEGYYFGYITEDSGESPVIMLCDNFNRGDKIVLGLWQAKLGDFHGDSLMDYVVKTGKEGAAYQLYYFDEWFDNETVSYDVFVEDGKVTAVDYKYSDDYDTQTASFTRIDDPVTFDEIFSMLQPYYAATIVSTYDEFVDTDEYAIDCVDNKITILDTYISSDGTQYPDTLVIDKFATAVRAGEDKIIAAYPVEKKGNTAYMLLSFRIENGKIVSINNGNEIPEAVKPGVPQTDVTDLSKITVPEAGAVNNITAEVKGNDLSATLGGDLTGIALTADESAAGVWVWMELNEKAAAEVPAADVTILEKALGNKTVGAYLDVNLFKQISGQKKTAITETEKPLTVTVTVPAEMRRADRTFSILYTHEGGDAVEVTPDSYDAQTGVLSFAASKFSTYALTYSDPAPVDDPIPEDTESGSPVIWIVIAIVAVIVLGVAAWFIIKKFRRK